MIVNYYTGLPPGDEHDHVAANGRDFITWTTEDGSGPFVITSGLSDMTAEDFSAMIDQINPAEWVRVRAMSAEDARGRHMDAFDQRRAFDCRSPDWQLVSIYEDESIRDRIINGGRATVEPHVCPHCNSGADLRHCSRWEAHAVESDARDVLEEYQCHATCNGRSFWV